MPFLTVKDVYKRQEIAVTDIKDTKIEGVTVLIEETEPYRENYFEWAASPLIASFQSSQISGGILSCQTAEPQFQEFEYHKDKEFFYFVQGTASVSYTHLDVYKRQDHEYGQSSQRTV